MADNSILFRALSDYAAAKGIELKYVQECLILFLVSEDALDIGRSLGLEFDTTSNNARVFGPMVSNISLKEVYEAHPSEAYMNAAEPWMKLADKYFTLSNDELRAIIAERVAAAA